MAVDRPKKGRGSKPSSASKPKEPESARTDALADPDENWADQPESEAYLSALSLYSTVKKAFENKQEQDDRIEEYWNIQNAYPDENQQYNGNTQGYVPAVRDAINARAKRATKQLFPANHIHVNAVSSDGKSPKTQLALLEHYIRTTNLKSIVRTDLIAGDVTGQWNLMVDWSTSTRKITNLVKRNPLVEMIDGESVEDLGIEDPTEEVEDTETEDVTEQGPEVIDFATQDLAVIPPTCNNLQKAKAVAVRMRLSPEAIREKVDEGVFILPEGVTIDELCEPDESKDRKNPLKKATKAAGVRAQGTDKHLVCFCVHTKLDFGGEHKEEGIIYFASETVILAIIRNPLWSGRRAILSEPVERVQGSFFGKSKIEPIKFLQWNLTDMWNMGQDSAMYTVLPIWSIDPVVTPQWQQLTMGLGAIWPTGDKVKALTQPQLWKEAMQICDVIKRQIWESLEVNEMMMGKMPQGRKNNAMIGGVQQEQSVNINDHASRYEDVMLNPLMEFLFEFDQQFRTDEIMIEQRGEIGVKAAIQTIPVPQWGEKYFFRWQGTEFMQNMQRMQQQIATMNVLKGIPPQLTPGKRLNLSPILENLVENVFGPEQGPRIFEDISDQFTIDPDTENEMLHNGFEVMVHESDNDQQHLQSHMRGAALAGDPLGLFKNHMRMHMEAIMKKRASQNPQAAGLPGAPGGAGPGVAGAPRPGALSAPGGGRPNQNPPGSIGADQMVDPGAMGRG